MNTPPATLHESDPSDGAGSATRAAQQRREGPALNTGPREDADCLGRQSLPGPVKVDAQWKLYYTVHNIGKIAGHWRK